MALIPHNFDLPFNILRCAYIEYGVTNLEASLHFYGDTLGLIHTETVDDAMYFRGIEEQDHHCYVLRKTKEPKALAVGFKVAFEEHLDVLETHLQVLGIRTEWVVKYAQERTLRAYSPQGIPLEFFAKTT